MPKKYFICSILFFLAVSFIFFNQEIFAKTEISIETPSKPAVMRAQHYSPVKDGRIVDTLLIDDGNLTSWGSNGDLTWKEAVKLTTTEPCTLISILLIPGDPSVETPQLHWSVWDDDGPGGLPGTQVASGTVASPPYGDWYQIDLSTPVYFDGGDIYPGWEDLTLPAIYMGLDSNFDGYNYWYDGAQWNYDDFFSGDFMIRAIVHTSTGVKEILTPFRQSQYSIQVFPNPMRRTGTISYSVPRKTDVAINIYDISGRLINNLMNSNVSAGSHAVSWDKKDVNGAVVPQGVYFYNFITPGYSTTGTITVF